MAYSQHVMWHTVGIQRRIGYSVVSVGDAFGVVRGGIFGMLWEWVGGLICSHLLHASKKVNLAVIALQSSTTNAWR